MSRPPVLISQRVWAGLPCSLAEPVLLLHNLLRRAFHPDAVDVGRVEGPAGLWGDRRGRPAPPRLDLRRHESGSARRGKTPVARRRPRSRPRAAPTPRGESRPYAGAVTLSVTANGSPPGYRAHRRGLVDAAWSTCFMTPALASEAELLVTNKPSLWTRPAATEFPLTPFRKTRKARGSPRDAVVVTRAKASEWEDEHGDVVPGVAQGGGGDCISR
jgi:hypothetical protein